MEQTKQNPLATESIGKLLLQFSVPTVMTLLVNCLYNIVDQIFVGHAVGIHGVAATNIAFPMITISAALALMLGDGCAANISLCLGKKEQQQAEKEQQKLAEQEETPAFCQNCGMALTKGQKFCGNCGNTVIK